MNANIFHFITFLLKMSKIYLISNKFLNECKIAANIYWCNSTVFFCSSVFAGCQIPYPKREFLNEDEPEEKGDKV